MCRRSTALAALLIVLAVAGAACGSDAGDDRPVVAAGFYPLAYLAQRLGGDDVRVLDLTPPGVEPHDRDLSPRTVGDVQDAAAVVYLGGFQPSVEAAARESDAPVVDLLEGFDVRDGDPHVWLDPVRMGELADGVATALKKSGALDDGDIDARLAELKADLAALDARYDAGLASCKTREIITSHDAFWYLAQRYGLDDVPVAGLSPELEPTARRLAEVADTARAGGATTIFFEELVNPRVAEAVAREAGGLRTAVLSPIETLSEKAQDAGDDYVDVMDRNLSALRAALDCV